MQTEQCYSSSPSIEDIDYITPSTVYHSLHGWVTSLPGMHPSVFANAKPTLQQHNDGIVCYYKMTVLCFDEERHA